MSLPTNMKAVILKESYRVAVEDVPVPQIKEDGDVLVKVHLAGLCGTSTLLYVLLAEGSAQAEGHDRRDMLLTWRTLADDAGSDLHFYRGTEGPATGFTLGHELLGEIVDVGKGIQKFKKGDLVIAPFSLSCGELPAGPHRTGVHPTSGNKPRMMPSLYH